LPSRPTAGKIGPTAAEELPEDVSLAHDVDDDRDLVLRRTDWSHLKGSLGKLQDARPNLSVWYAVAFAAAAVAGASILPVASAKDLPLWVTPLYVCVSLSCAIIGAVLVWLDKRFGQEIRSRIRDIEADIREIEQGAEPGPNA
jgi:hypothetical protein